jgi:LysR family transcriptional regulator, regulator of abg operon
MRLSQIRDFVAVLECGSINAAARSLGVSQPGITKSIKSLEAELKAQLVQRTSRGVVPTQTGRAFLARARVAHAELRKAIEDIDKVSDEQGGRVSFGTGPYAASMIVPAAIAQFRRRFPKAALRVVEGFIHALVPLVRDETLDFAIGPQLLSFRGSGIAFRPLFHHERVVAGRRGHPLRDARSLGELARASWLTFEPIGFLDRMFTDVGLQPPRPVIECESHSAFLALLATTDMLGVVPLRILSWPSIPGAIQDMCIAERLPSLTVGIFTRADTPLTPTATALSKALLKVGRELAFSR